MNEWDDVSRASHLAWRLRENDRCGRCGTVHADLVGPDGSELRDFPLVAKVAKCLGCEALEMEQADHDKLGHGETVVLVPVESEGEVP